LVELGTRTLQDCTSLSPYDGPRIVFNVSHITRGKSYQAIKERRMWQCVFRIIKTLKTPKLVVRFLTKLEFGLQFKYRYNVR